MGLVRLGFKTRLTGFFFGGGGASEELASVCCSGSRGFGGRDDRDDGFEFEPSLLLHETRPSSRAPAPQPGRISPFLSAAFWLLVFSWDELLLLLLLLASQPLELRPTSDLCHELEPAPSRRVAVVSDAMFFCCSQ